MVNESIAVTQVREIFQEMFAKHEENMKSMISENIKKLNNRMKIIEEQLTSTDANVATLNKKYMKLTVMFVR